MARLPSFITRAEGKRGVTYEPRINVVLQDGRRLQPKRRFKTLEAAKGWHATTSAELAAGTHTAPSDVTVKQAVDAWLTAKAVRVKPTTSDAYTAALQPVVDRYGYVLAQKITKHDVEVLITELRTGTTERGVWKRTSTTVPRPPMVRRLHLHTIGSAALRPLLGQVGDEAVDVVQGDRFASGQVVERERDPNLVVHVLIL